MGGGGTPAPPEPHVRTWEEELADRIASLKNWLVLLAVISVASLGIAVYAVVQASDNSSSPDSGVSASQLDDLEKRVSDLEDGSTSDESVSQLKSEVADLNDKVRALESSGAEAVSEQEFTALQQQVADLTQQIEGLQSGQTQ